MGFDNLLLADEEKKALIAGKDRHTYLRFGPTKTYITVRKDGAQVAEDILLGHFDQYRHR